MSSWAQRLQGDERPQRAVDAQRITPTGGSAYGRAALDAEAAKLRCTAEGSRNDQLNRAAYAAGQLIAGGELDEGEARAALAAAALACGLGERETKATINSGVEAGKLEPRSAPPRESRPTRRRSGHGGPPVEPQSNDKRTDEPAPFPIIDAAGIFARLEPLKYVIQAIDLCPGAPGMWAGYGYSGKTIAAQSAAVAIAGGLGRVWDCFSAPRGRVLHIDYEQGSRLTRERYQRLAMPHMLGPADLDSRLALSCMPRTYLDQDGAEDALERAVDGFSLVVIDSLRAAAPTLEENSSEVRRTLDMLTRISERTGAAFLVIHHARKPSQNQAGGTKMAIRGSGALFDACGSVLVFEGEKGQPVRVSHEKARASGQLCDDFELAITDVPDGQDPRAGLLVTASAAPSREDEAEERERARRQARLERVKAELEALFAREPEQGGADTIAFGLKRSPVDVRQALRVLIDAGKVRATGRTRNLRHEWVDSRSKGGPL